MLQYSVLSNITRDNGRCLTEALNTILKKGIKSPVFHQFNIPNISPGQADSTRLPKKTYGIQLKGSSFSKTVSFSLNFLRRLVWTCFRLKKKKKVEVLQCWRSEFSQDTATFHPRCCSKVCLLSKMWANLRHHYLPFSSLAFKGTLRGKNTQVNFLWFAGGYRKSSISWCRSWN